MKSEPCSVPESLQPVQLVSSVYVYIYHEDTLHEETVHVGSIDQDLRRYRASHCRVVEHSMSQIRPIKQYAKVKFKVFVSIDQEVLYLGQAPLLT